MGDAILAFFGAPIAHQPGRIGGADIIQSIEPYRNAGVTASDPGARFRVVVVSGRTV